MGNMVICPTTAFLALDGLKKNGVYKSRTESTGPIVCFEWAIHLTTLKEIESVAPLKHGGDELEACHDLYIVYR